MEPNEIKNLPFSSIMIEKDYSKLATDMKDTQIHNFYELYFLLSGQRRYFIGGNIYNVAPGNLIVVPKNEIHKTGALNSRGWDRYVLYFSEKSVQDLIRQIGQDEFQKFAQIACFQFPPEATKLLKDKFDRLYAEENRPDAYSYQIKKDLLYDIIITTLRFGSQKPCDIDDGADKIRLAAQYISENYRSEITLESAAAIACMEKTYFSKRFKALTGLCFSAYLSDIRLIAAKRLLLSTDMNINEISEACGFSSGNYFGDVFAKATGMSPIKFRKSNRSIE